MEGMDRLVVVLAGLVLVRVSVDGVLVDFEYVVVTASPSSSRLKLSTSSSS